MNYIYMNINYVEKDIFLDKTRTL